MDIEIKEAKTFFEKLRGLMLKKKPNHGLLITLEKEKRIGASIHSLFVFFKFDAVFLDKQGKIVDIREKIKPFNPLIVPKKPCKHILELPAGKVEEEGIEKGQKLDLN